MGLRDGCRRISGGVGILGIDGEEDLEEGKDGGRDGGKDRGKERCKDWAGDERRGNSSDGTYRLSVARNKN